MFNSKFGFDAQNVHYLTKEHMDDGLLKDYEMSSGEILLKFFRFYGLSFDPYQNAIDVSQSMTQKVVDPLTPEKA